jgi:biopolymer transport protein ExbD
MAANLGENGGFASEINITPLVDVVLVLLIIFMMIVPVMLRGYEVDVPGEAASEPSREARPEQVVMTIGLEDCPALDRPDAAGLPAGCTVRLNDDEVSVSALAARIGDTFADRAPAERVLFLAAHDRLNYEAVMRILDVAKSGMDGLRIGIVTEE